MSHEIVIVSAKRTPMGGFQGGLSTLSATDLGASAIKGAIDSAGLNPEQVGEVYMGCVLPAGLGQAPARQAALKAGLPESSPCTTVNKVCGSGMKTVMMAADQLKAGYQGVIVAGGMESMSNAPYMTTKARAGFRMGHQKIYDHMFLDGLEDAYDGNAMGVHAQKTANDYSLTREGMDEFALRSLSRANEAIENGWFDDEIVPVEVKSRKGSVMVSVDEQPGLARPDKIPQLRPAFDAEGTITAANSSSISDGASALAITTAAEAERLGLKPIARIVDYCGHAQAPSTFTCAPIGATRQLLDNNNLTVDDIDLAEVNEAFAMVTMLAMQEVGFGPEKTNISGGACALGHPLGSSGSRIIVTLLNNLRRTGGKRGLATLCIGGGEATAILVEMI